MLETPKRWAVHLIGLIAALSMAPAAYSQHEAGEVYLGVAAGYHVAPQGEFLFSSRKFRLFLGMR